ncbi:hypothetical protein U14_04953 [Candidatus Moduliflexus flocculans]|uniref:Uncharacterized protein n=1 Tax=Candidatus Moduliflexus flocculans TaxID=1499966 RepID=A0A081BQK1_9BACT|nr:hypothetical protein U14_04953 [Candidatus Moduliflexus flocculans]
MATKKAEVRLLFSNGKEDVITVEYDEGDERLQPSYYLGGSEKDEAAIESKIIRIGNKAYRTKYIVFAEIIEEQGESLGAYV